MPGVASELGEKRRGCLDSYSDCHSRTTFSSLPIVGEMALDNGAVETTDVIVVGCGPTAALLAAYLGRSSVRNVVLERDADITTDPRGVTIDEDAMRLLQGLGLYDKLFTKIGSRQ